MDYTSNGNGNSNGKNNGHELTKHHIFPRSRCKELGIHKPNAEWNITSVQRREHELYHALFSNKTPEEIIEYLCEKFWNNTVRPPKTP
jgi:hypothetical protein